MVQFALPWMNTTVPCVPLHTISSFVEFAAALPTIPMMNDAAAIAIFMDLNRRVAHGRNTRRIDDARATTPRRKTHRCAHHRIGGSRSIQIARPLSP